VNDYKPGMPDVSKSFSRRRQWLNQWSLRSWLMATVLLAVGLAVLSSTVLIERFARAHAERRAADALRQMAGDFRDALDRGMAQQFQEVLVLSELDPFRRPDNPAATRRALDQARHGFEHFAWIGVTDPSGVVLAAAGGLLEGENVAKRPWWRGAQSGPFVGDVHDAVLLEKLLPRHAEPWRFVDFAVPIRNARGEVTGVFGSHLSWSWARAVKRELIDAAMAEHDAEALVIARDGTVLLGPPALEGKPLAATAPALLHFTSLAGAPRLVAVDGEPNFVVSAVTQGKGNYPGLGWTVLLRQPAAVALADYYRLRHQIVLTALVLLAVFVPLAWWESNRLTRPLLQLTTAIEARHHLGEARMPRLDGYREARLLSAALADLSDRQAQQDAMLESRVAERTAALQEAMAQLARSEQRLERLSRTDTLTACPNRRYFDERLPEAMARSQRSRLPMALLFVDVDRFKPINDELGHAAGDAVLAEVASRLSTCVRGTDTVARLGGDEFVVILEGLHGADEPGRIASKIVAEIARPFLVNDMKLMVSVSVGVASYQGDDRSGAELLAQADSALYEAKSAGRGTFRLAAPSAG
jgi:diguanylate cyclase (GGDEF)-like protein